MSPRQLYVDMFQLRRSAGGYVTYCISLMQVLARVAEDLGLKVTVLVNEEGRFITAPYETANVNLSRVYTLGATLRNVVKRERMAFVHRRAAWLYPGNIGTLFLPRASLAVVHDLKYLHVPASVPWAKRCGRAMFVRLTARRAHRLCAISDFTRSALIEAHGIPNDRVRRIYPATAIGDGCQAAKPGGAPYFLSVLTRQSHKNAKTLIEAFRERPNERLVLVGDWSGVVERLGAGMNVEVRNNLTDGELSELFAGCQAFLFPSVYEGLGLPVVEAVLHGRPVVASDIPPVREITNSLAELVSEPFSVSAWVEAIDRFAGVAYVEEMSERAKLAASIAAGTFSWERMIDAYRAELADLLAVH